MLDIQSGSSTLLYEDLNYGEPTWVGETEFIFLKSGDNGHTSLLLADASSPGSESVIYKSSRKGVLLTEQ